jgi:uncharacterized membrane protein
MLRGLIASIGGGELILQGIEYAALAIEVLAVIIIGLSIFYGVIRYIFQGIGNFQDEARYQELRLRLGRSLLLGLEILVAADIVRTVGPWRSRLKVAGLGSLPMQISMQNPQRMICNDDYFGLLGQ